MDGGWRILDMTTARGSIDVERGAIVVTTQEGETAPVPTADIALVSDGLSVTSAFAALARRYGRFVEGERDTLDVLSWQGI